jgi:putative effector of murein hydrolase LrgA (UPF0299 family)
MTSVGARAVPDWIRSARDLYLVAMAVFFVNIVIGILNGADAVEFDHNQILTHVHAGTVGWLTLAIIAAATLMFRATDRRLVVALAIFVPIYVLAFYTGNFAFRALGGTALLVVIGWLLVWLWQQFLAGERSLPRLAVTLGLTSFGYGAVLGVLIQIALAAGVSILPGDYIGAHASAMTFGYLVLVAFGVIEWRVLDTRDLPRAGLVQVLSLFIGGLVISIALLVGAEQAGGGIYLLTQLVAVVLFVVRIWPRSLRVSWLQAAPIRHVAAASLWVVAALILFMYIVFTFISKPDDPNALPLNILIASDHAVYIGVITNGALGLLSIVALSQAQRGSWIGHLIFWGVNLGLLVFVIGLIVDTSEVKRIGAPVMGITLLFALAILAYNAIRASDDQLGAAAAHFSGETAST